MKFAVGQPVTRIEDTRLITGQGKFTDDLKLPNMANGVFLRSPYAHANILSIDIDEALKMPGVIDIFTGDRLKEEGLGHMSVIDFLENKDGTPMNASKRPILAIGKVRHVGDPLVFIVAETINQALDASELVDISYEELPCVIDTAKALNKESPILFEEFGTNSAVDWEIGSEKEWRDIESKADIISKVDLINNRIVVNPIEPRSSTSDYNKEKDSFTVYVESQGAHAMRERLAGSLGVEEKKIKVITNDVGGGFGLKMMCFPEYVATMFASRALNRPVKWTSTRSEAFLSDSHGRDHVTEASIAMDKEGNFLGVKVDTIAAVGAYLSQYGIFIPTLAGAGMHVGVYKIPVLYNKANVVYTNTVPVDAYRGAGRPEASYVIERLVDKAAYDLGMDPVELRVKNFVQPGDLGKHEGAILPLDSCDFQRTTEMSLINSSYADFVKRKEKSKLENKIKGIGISYYIERTQGEGADNSRVVISSEGSVKVYAGTQSTGQGHETAWTQIIVEKLGVNPEDVSIHFGNSDDLPGGGGTGGSKSLYMAAGAINDASDVMLKKGIEIAAI